MDLQSSAESCVTDEQLCQLHRGELAVSEGRAIYRTMETCSSLQVRFRHTLYQSQVQTNAGADLNLTDEHLIKLLEGRLEPGERDFAYWVLGQNQEANNRFLRLLETHKLTPR
jgi:hypothetical protein